MSLNPFQRTQLLLGDDSFHRLRAAHVAVVGCGAVGGFAVEALARAGIGKLTLIDGDKAEESNINRQLCALHSTLNQYKTEILKNRIWDICPDTQVQTHPVFLTSANAEELFADTPDFVIDAIDILKDKISLILFLQEKKIPFISAMGAARKIDWRQIRISPLNQTKTCPLAARLRKELKAQGADLSFPCVYSLEAPLDAQAPNRQMGSIVTITGAFGLIIANEVILRIAHHV
ncbi:MAG: tRNA threonylcarbamoyladenosine dehydratase [Alphaproteobacteria bacterium]|nr:tRNA threonylcarbamoyladenosine dehydratase [Alphaproteobacteria bacterium]